MAAMTRLLIVSDIHGALGKAKRLEDVSRDVTVVAGDIAECGSVEEAVEILETLASQGGELVWVPGNCDSPKLLEAEAPGVNVHGRAASVEGLVFAGAGGSIYTPFNTPFEYDDATLEKLVSQALSQAPEGSPVVLVVHTPPHSSGLDRVAGGEYVGSRALRRILAAEAGRLLLLATGHIHESWGVASVEGVAAVNPGPLNAGRYALAEYDPEAGVLRVRLAKLSG
ncbi:MAG: hypothetical protein GXO15_05095 [Crenarchaeota archaeon]|nr:hypothetical protein [Thermoproteota archaeon]